MRMKWLLGVLAFALVAAWFAWPALVAQQPVAGQPELKVGDAALAFTLPASDGKTYSLSKLRGRAVVLAWFPKAFTAGCTAECKALRESGHMTAAFDPGYFM